MAPGARKDKCTFAGRMSSRPQFINNQHFSQQFLTAYCSQILVPPRVGEMAAYASLRRDSVVRPSIERSPSRVIREGLKRLGRLIDWRRGRGRPLSHHPLGITIHSSDTSLLHSSPESEFGPVESVTTFCSDDTLNNEIEYSHLSLNAEKFPLSIGSKEAELVLWPPRLKNKQDIAQINVHFRNDEQLEWRKQKYIIKLPKAVRKDIWRHAVVHNRKLFICSC